MHLLLQLLSTYTIYLMLYILYIYYHTRTRFGNSGVDFYLLVLYVRLPLKLLTVVENNATEKTLDCSETFSLELQLFVGHCKKMQHPDIPPNYDASQKPDLGSSSMQNYKRMNLLALSYLQWSYLYHSTLWDARNSSSSHSQL